jgi:hypothetical protein
MDESSPLLRYRNREVREADIAVVRTMVLERPDLGRTALSLELCRRWDWRQANGGYAQFACADLLLRLEERGFVELPPRLKGPKVKRKHPLLPAGLIPIPWLPVSGPLGSATLEVRPTSREERFGVRVYVERYHYLGWQAPIGEHLIHAAFLDGELVALVLWAAAAAHVMARERFIGWDEQTRRRRLQLVANNVRFLVFPWVRVKHLASKILAASTRRLTADWTQVHGHPVYLAETFVDTGRFRGTCYRAAGWRCLGQTAGRSKRGNQFLYGSSPKGIFVRELHRRALPLLRGVWP